MIIRWREKVLLAKIETTYGTDPTPTGSANAILATNVQLQPMAGQDVSRNLERPYSGGQARLPVGLHCILSFDVELAPSGTAGTAPAWGPLLRMCSIAETITPTTSVEYEPITSNPESGTIYMHVGPNRHKMTGARGTVVFKATAQGIPVMSFSFTGLFSEPTAETLPDPDFTSFLAPQVVTNANTPTFTIGGTEFILRSFELDRANSITTRFLVNSESIQVSNSEEVVKVQVEPVALATYNPYSIPQTQTQKAIRLVHGAGAGKISTFDIDYAQQRRFEGYAIQDDIVEWPLIFDCLPDAGDDQWKLTLT